MIKEELYIVIVVELHFGENCRIIHVYVIYDVFIYKYSKAFTLNIDYD